jgi:protoporphyrinogen oxidase
MSPAGKTSLVFEYPYQKGDEIDTMSNEEIISLTISNFTEYFSKKTKRSDVFKAQVIYVDKAYPKYDLHYSKALKKINDYIDNNLKNLQIVGRNGMFHYNNMDHSVYTGLLAARNILAGKKIYNLKKVNNEAEYLEEKR